MRLDLVAATAAIAALTVGSASAQDRPQRDRCDQHESRAVHAFPFPFHGGDRPVIGLATKSGSPRDTLGVLITEITPNGPADKAGLQEGDRIVSVNGVDLRLTPADANDPEMRGLMSRRLARTVQKTKPGDPIELRVYANGQTKNIKVTSVKASDLFNQGFLRVGQSDWNAPELGSLMLQFGPMTGDPAEHPLPPIPPMPPMPPIPPTPPMPPMPPGGGPGHDGGGVERQFPIGAPAAPVESGRENQEVEL
jgi:membrane-associated protease RseP (regulator of RpoE activity)